MPELLTSGEVVSRLRNLLYTDPVYMWGANGETITPELVLNLQHRFISNNHTPEYYDEKLEEYRGKKAVDDIGMLNFLSNENLSLQEYISNAKQVLPAVNVGTNQVRILCDTKMDGTPRIGVYLGNGNAIIAHEGYPGMHEAPAELSKWSTAFLPHFMNEEAVPNQSCSIIENYQNWLNDCAAGRRLGTVPITGHYDDPTKTLSLLIAKQLYGELVGTPFDATAEIKMTEIASQIGQSFRPGYSVEKYDQLMYIISTRLYVLGMLPEFIEVWGNANMIPMKDFGIRLSAMQRGIKSYVISNRYLDSVDVRLPLLRELFCDISK